MDRMTQDTHAETLAAPRNSGRPHPETTAADASPSREEWSAHLRSRGLRVTQQRLAVLAALHEQGHLLADEVSRAVRTGGGRTAEMSLQSVYVVLGDLERTGLVRKVDLGTGGALFETRVGDNHHHAICRVCGFVEDVPCAVGRTPCLDPGATSIRVDTAEVIFRGVCSACAASDSNNLGVKND